MGCPQRLWWQPYPHFAINCAALVILRIIAIILGLNFLFTIPSNTHQIKSLANFTPRTERTASSFWLPRSSQKPAYFFRLFCTRHSNIGCCKIRFPSSRSFVSSSGRISPISASSVRNSRSCGRNGNKGFSPSLHCDNNRSV